MYSFNNISKVVIDNFVLAGQQVVFGERKKIEIPVASLFDYTKISIPVEVIRGLNGGPAMFVSAAIHGDEIIGVEILKRLLANEKLKDISGTLIVVPIVNPFGYNNNIRYLPDRRDLNRCFPGTDNGSLASRIAHTFITEVVYKCSYGIDIHSGAIHRFNYPQVRLEIKNETELMMAKAFAAPVIINSPLRDGTLRTSAQRRGIRTLLYEAGEALRFDEHAIDIGVTGILNVMHQIGMINNDNKVLTDVNMMIAKSSHWIRAPESGSLRMLKKMGEFVLAGELLGEISDPYGDRKYNIMSSCSGIIIGGITMPLVNRGNALVHIATIEDLRLPEVSADPSIVLDKDIDVENEDWFINKNV